MEYGEAIKPAIVKFWRFVVVVNEEMVVDAATGVSVLDCSCFQGVRGIANIGCITAILRTIKFVYHVRLVVSCWSGSETEKRGYFQWLVVGSYFNLVIWIGGNNVLGGYFIKGDAVSGKSLQVV